MAGGDIQRDPRYAIRNSEIAYVEFAYPNSGGRMLRLPLIDLSVAGMAFALDEDLPLLVRGARLSPVTLRVGECRIEGSCVVKHVTRRRASGFLCGAVFYPETEQDMARLSGVLDHVASQTV
jgi:hypothetical protein